MAVLPALISDIVNGKDEICTLCFRKIEGDAFDVEDEVILADYAETSVMLSKIVLSIIVFSGENTVITNKLCENCTRAAVASFTFIEKCKKSRKVLSDVVSNLSNCVLDTTVEKKKINSLYIAVEPNGMLCKNYYDKYYMGYKTAVSKALKRFKILSRNRVEGIKKKKKLEKVQTDLNNYSDNDEIQADRNIESDIDAKVFNCEACPRKFPNSKQARAHFVRVHAPKIHKCTECPRMFGANYLLKLHKSESHTAAMCAICGKTYSNIHSLKMHSFSHAKLTCPICNREYKTRNSYRKHVSSKICMKEYGTKRMNVPKNYTCDICSKSFAHKGTLQVHINFEHEGGKCFICSWCNKKFPAQSRLKSHIVKHTKERNFTCDVCGGKFVTKEALLYHTRIHTGETPYGCPHCDMKFLSASRRMDHVRRKHMGPTLECDVCSSKFRTPCSLRKHKRRHFNPNSRLFQQNVVTQPIIPESVEV